MEFTRASQVATGVLFHSSMMKSRSWWMLESLRSSTFRLRMLHRCSIGFRSGDMLGQSITFTLRFFSKAVVVLEVCLGLLCWNTALQPDLWMEGIMLCFSMSQYMLTFIVPSMNCSSPVLAALMQPQTMTLPPPCLTVGKTHLSLYSSPGCRHTRLTSSEPNNVSWSHQTTGHGMSIPACLSSANCLQAFLCIIFRRGFLLGRQPCRPIWCSVRHMVWALTGWPPTPSTSAAMLAELIRLFPKHNHWIWHWARVLNFFGRPWRGLFWVEPVLLNHCMVLATCCSSVSGSWQSSYLRHLYVEQQLVFSDPQSSLPWGAMLNFQWPVWESESDNTKFITSAPHSHLRPCNNNESHDAEPDFTKCDMFLDQHLCWPWNTIVINQSDLKIKFIILVKCRFTINICCLYIHIIHL